MIRVATIDDADDLARVHVEGWRWGYRGIMPDDYLASLTVEARAARWREIFRTAWVAMQQTWIAHDDEGCTGFASSGPARGEAEGVGELYALYVAERAAGKGVASMLHARALDHLRAEGVTHAILWVLEDNLRARRFYEREGWRADGGEKDEAFGGRTLRELRYAIDFH